MLLNFSRYFQKITTVCIVFFLFFSVPIIVWGHPLDISNSSFTISGNQVTAITYFHPSQVEATIAATGIPLRSLTYDDYLLHKEALFDYIKSHTEFRDDAGNSCTTDGFHAELTGIDDLFIKGFPVEYTATCPGSVNSFTYSLKIYTHLPLQTNRVSIYDGKTGNRVSYKVLTAKIDRATYRAGVNVPLLDTDKDILPDEEEAIYRTDPNSPDTDNDYYSDYEEVSYGWNPLDSRLSPGQLGRNEPKSGDVVLPNGIVQNHSGESIDAGKGASSSNGEIISNKSPSSSSSLLSPISQDTLYSNSEDSTLLDTITFGYYRSILKELESIRKNGMNQIQLLSVGGILFLLGLLHALGPGHSKGFMAAYIIGSGASLLRSLQYAMLFTAVHLLDVIIMVFALKFADGYFDVQSSLSYIMKAGVVVLVIMSIGLMYKSVKTFLVSRKSGSVKISSFQKITPQDWKSGIYMAAITGLAPCSFAWSILLILFAIGRLDLVTPLLFFFGLGVFIALSGVACLIYFLREKIARFAGSRYEYIFPVFSSIFLLLFSGIFALAILF